MTWLRSARHTSFAVLAVLLVTTAAAPAPVPPSFVYAHSNDTPNQVFGFSVGEDGALTALAGSPFLTNNSTSNCGGACQTAAYAAGRRLLFTTGGDGVSVSSVATDGTLSLVEGSPFGATKFLGVATIEMGESTFVYAAETDADQVRGYSVLGNNSLSEVPGSPFAAGMQLDGMAAAKSFVFAASDASAAVAAFKVQADGSLVAAPGSPFPIATNPGCLQNVVCDPKGKTVYLPDFAGPIRVFGFRVRTKDAKLTKVAGSPSKLKIDSVSAVAMRKSSALYAFGPVSGDAADVQYVRRVGTGSLFGGATSKSGLTFARSGAVDPSGHLVVIAGDTATGAQIVSLLVGKKGKLAPAGSAPLTDADARTLNAVVFATP